MDKNDTEKAVRKIICTWLDDRLTLLQLLLPTKACTASSVRVLFALNRAVLGVFGIGWNGQSTAFNGVELRVRSKKK